MLPLLATTILAIITNTVRVTAADTPFNFCTDNECTDCPASITSDGSGYPNCVVYDTATVLAAGVYSGSDGGGYSVFLDVEQPAAGCATVIRSPAGPQIPGCGAPIGAYYNAACSAQALDTTFMVQFCCGTGDCEDVGLPRLKGRSLDATSSVGGLYLKDRNGTRIEPLEVGPAIDSPRFKSRETKVASLAPSAKFHEKRDSCKWVIDEGSVPGGYTKPADAVEVVSQAVAGGTSGATIAVTETREASFSSTVMAGVSLDVFNAGVSFTYEMSVSSSTQVMVPIAAGSVGELGFTPTLRCTHGTLTCGSDVSTGEACTGFMTADDVAGTYFVIALS